MIYGTGIDLTEINRIQTLRQRFAAFVPKVLTPAEQDVMNKLKGQRQNEFLAGRFSAKEAYSKAYGTGLGSAVGFQDVEILDDDEGRPHLTKQPFDGPAHISISHTETLVMTEVILETVDSTR
ncbi:MAG: holo-ACP synthase [Furfurilactobacillus sp.]|jgi:holo-[acyl-carrier protein] synthase|uniref:Holo-[acyl-carrier-protein] synthase n=1 Tax=Furfurilactobacillus milii TaxID=2888272 RepID=A0ABT6D8P1_9LACO|nr:MULTISPECIES: holo-ACP synthase [Furfurilactobacillus]QLE65966.1 Holo-acyl-carrier protein synthase [Furfurilactobacillus rossiae]MCF6160128.1 holo-ACP synthase [Furfurilactobacillus milii]MCF6162071.1 holo-ACP synthase [Furfurilactobacillus milii]MCF6420302.1 holo-ACP synthase [Furfurilactobacillus milii]MCH4012487.1 holo-ACP synthase [Furfurilactobacillus sp.]